MDPFESLTASYFDGSLTEREAADLAHVLDNDTEKAARFVGEYEIDRLLALRGTPVDESRIDAILAQIQQENDPFVQSVFEAIERETSGPTRQVQVWRNWVTQIFSRPGWVWLAAACFGFLCCASFFYYGITSGEPKIELTENSSIDVVRNGVLTGARRGFALRAGDVLNAGTNSTAIRYAPEKTRITIRPGTELKLVSASGAKRFVLDAGRIEASVARQRTFRPMIIVTPQAEARVLGTEFVLTVTNNATHLDVAEGKVRLTRRSDGARVVIAGGQYTVAATNRELAALPQTGGILREYWTNLANNSLASAGSTLKSKRSLVARPDGFDYLPRFESVPLGRGLRFTERIRGYVHPPKTGPYRLAITTVHVETVLHLSRSDKPADVVQVAWRHPDGGGLSLQEVTPVPLKAGRKYYIEIVHESDGGEEHLTVMWQAPGREPEIMPGEFLSPFPIEEKKGKR